MTTQAKAKEVNERTIQDRCHKFIEQAIIKHGDNFDYSLVPEDYINGMTKVRIICSIHGVFHQLPNGHLNTKYGCFECGEIIKKENGRRRKLTTEEFAEKAKLTFGNLYDYSQTVYTTGSSPVTIICPIHGPFTVARAEKHWTVAQGCPSCVNVGSMPEQIIADTLTTQNVSFHREYKFDDCLSPTSNRKLRFDFVIPNHNMIIEFHGDQHFKKSSMMHKGDKFERMQEHDQVKKAYALNNGYTFIELTTKDIAQLQDIIVRLVQ